MRTKRKPGKTEGRQMTIVGHKEGVVATVDLNKIGMTLLERDVLFGGLEGVLVKVATDNKQRTLTIATTAHSKKRHVEAQLLKILPRQHVGRFMRCWGSDRNEATRLRRISLAYCFWRLTREGF